MMRQTIRFERERKMLSKSQDQTNDQQRKSPLQLNMFNEEDVCLSKNRQNIIKVERRYYTLILEKDLFDVWTIICVHGQIGSQLGRVRQEKLSTNLSEALDHFEKLCQKRIKKRYKPMVTIF